MRSVEDLTAVSEPAWPQLEAELQTNPEITVLPIAGTAGRDSLYRLQITTRSRMGALALHTGGLLVDHGWLRVLGGGDERGLPSLAEANGLPGDEQPPAALLIGHDVLGGRFEVSGPDPAAAGRPGDPGEVCYFGPDTLAWEPLGAGHGAWLSWVAAGGTTEFYTTAAICSRPTAESSSSRTTVMLCSLTIGSPSQPPAKYHKPAKDWISVVVAES